jgi:hypothetical protein
MNDARTFPSPFGRGQGEGDPLAMNMSNTLDYLRGELGKQSVKRKAGFGKCVLEVGFINKILLAVYNKIFNWYYS